MPPARVSPSLLLFVSLLLAVVLSSSSANYFHLRVGHEATAPTSSSSSSATTEPQLPVFFFHGVTANASAGANFEKNLTAEGRVFTALSFCTEKCSGGPLKDQVKLAILQIRSIVSTNPNAYAHGYIFVGHSQGGAIARAVVEEMDDHNVRMLVSLAGAQNGIFYGPQPSDALPTLAFIKRIGPNVVPPALFNFSKYASPADLTGKFQFDFNEVVFEQEELQAKVSVINLARSPVAEPWAESNPFLPSLNNIYPCEVEAQRSNGGTKAIESCQADQVHRRRNFLKLQSAHFFGSSGDDVIAPWQSSILGKYQDVMYSSQIRDEFADFKVVKMGDTTEYKHNTYGLKTLDKRGGLFLHAVPKISHSCWVGDSTPMNSTTPCLFTPVYEHHVYPLFKQADAVNCHQQQAM